MRFTSQSCSASIRRPFCVLVRGILPCLITLLWEDPQPLPRMGPNSDFQSIISIWVSCTPCHSEVATHAHAYAQV